MEHTFKPPLKMFFKEGDHGWKPFRAILGKFRQRKRRAKLKRPPKRLQNVHCDRSYSEIAYFRSHQIWVAAGFEPLKAHAFRCTEMLLRGVQPDMVCIQGRWPGNRNRFSNIGIKFNPLYLFLSLNLSWKSRKVDSRLSLDCVFSMG